MFGMEAVTLRRRILQYWVNGLEGVPQTAGAAASVPVFVLMVAAAQVARLAPDNAADSAVPSSGDGSPLIALPSATAAAAAAGSAKKRGREDGEGEAEADDDAKKDADTKGDGDNANDAAAEDNDDEDSQEAKKARKAKRRDASLEHDADDGAVHSLPTSSFTRHLRDLNRYRPPQTAGSRSRAGAAASSSSASSTSAFGAALVGGARGPRVASANLNGSSASAPPDNTDGQSHTATAAASEQQPMSEVTELQALRILRVLTKERGVSCTGAFADYLRSSNLLGSLASSIQPRTRASTKLCCVAVELLSELIRTNAPRILQLIIQSHALDAIVRLHETLPRRSSVLSSTILSVFNAVASSVTEARQRALANGGAAGGLGGLGGMGLGGSPYLSRIGGGNESSESNASAPDLSLVDHVLLHFSSYVRYFAPHILKKLERVKEADGDGAGGEESSAVTSCFGEARALSESEFNAILAEYGCSPTSSPTSSCGGASSAGERSAGDGGDSSSTGVGGLNSNSNSNSNPPQQAAEGAVGSSPPASPSALARDIAARHSVSPPSTVDTGTVLSSIPAYDDDRTVPEEEGDDADGGEGSSSSSASSSSPVEEGGGGEGVDSPIAAVEGLLGNSNASSTATTLCDAASPTDDDGDDEAPPPKNAAETAQSAAEAEEAHPTAFDAPIVFEASDSVTVAAPVAEDAPATAVAAEAVAAAEPAVADAVVAAVVATSTVAAVATTPSTPESQLPAISTASASPAASPSAATSAALSSAAAAGDSGSAATTPSCTSAETAAAVASDAAVPVAETEVGAEEEKASAEEPTEATAAPVVGEKQPRADAETDAAAAATPEESAAPVAAEGASPSAKRLRSEGGAQQSPAKAKRSASAGREATATAESTEVVPPSVE